MKTKKNFQLISKSLRVGAMTLALSVPSVVTLVQAQPTSAAVQQMSFPTSKLAADALVRAAENYDVPGLVLLLGAEGKDLVASEDPVADKARAHEFATKAKEKLAIVPDPKNSKRATVVVGNDDFPLPIPLVKRGTNWYFDTKAGHDEILIRRVGQNELNAIHICRGYVEAQNIYSKTIHDNSGVNQYAQKIVSTPGKQDGLAWRNPDGSFGGPIGEAAAKALEEGYVDKTKPFHGYFFKILKGQGPNVVLGQMDYVIDGAMIAGFALVAVPAEYRVTGVKTFLVSYDGIVYEKDLGPDSLNLVKAMDRYNPDKTWKVTNDSN